MKFVIFDIDGTLTNTKDVDDKCFIEAFYNTFQIDIKNENWANLKDVTDWGITEEIIIRECGRKPDRKELNSMLTEHVRLLKLAKEEDPSQFEIIKNANAFLKAMLAESDYKVGIATGACEKSAVLKLKPFNLDLDKIAFSNSNKYKSREEITKDVINQLAIKQRNPDEVIYLGDGAWDYTTCQNLGIRFIGIDYNQDGKLKALGAKNVFKDFEDVKAIKEIISNGL